jgi:Bax protein
MLRFAYFNKYRPFKGLTLWLSGMMLVLLAILSACQQATPPLPPQPAPATVQVIEPDDLDTLRNFFKAHDYDWDRLGAGVPPFIVTRFPEDLDHHLPPDEKKPTFLLSLLPMVLMANQAIEAERLEIESLLSRHDHQGLLTEEELQLLQDMADYYKLPGNPLTDHLARAILLHRVDILPPSLVLAQAATESGWGTSRFAREGNNLFGQRTYRTGNGIVPAHRREGDTHEVKRFGTLFASVRSYMRNLNTHEAYSELRDLRAKLRLNGKPLSGALLAEGLEAYSTRNKNYIADVRAIIRANDLSRTNQTFLRAALPSAAPTLIPTVAALLASRTDAAALPFR